MESSGNRYQLVTFRHGYPQGRAAEMLVQAITLGGTNGPEGTARQGSRTLLGPLRSGRVVCVRHLAGHPLPPLPICEACQLCSAVFSVAEISDAGRHVRLLCSACLHRRALLWERFAFAVQVHPIDPDEKSSDEGSEQ